MAKITFKSAPFGCYLVCLVDGGTDMLVQSDFDLPGLASVFGWFPTDENGYRLYDTDGTIPSKRSQKSVSEFINDARQFLDEHEGDEADDPGYFDGEGE